MRFYIWAAGDEQGKKHDICIKLRTIASTETFGAKSTSGFGAIPSTTDFWNNPPTFGTKRTFDAKPPQARYTAYPSLNQG